MREYQIEKHFRTLVKRAGGLTFKFVSPSNRGVPDRIVIWPGGTVWFVELKTENGQLTDLQKLRIKEISEKGANAAVLYGLEEVKAWVETSCASDWI